MISDSKPMKMGKQSMSQHADVATQFHVASKLSVPHPFSFRWHLVHEIIEIFFSIVVIYALVNLLSMRYIVHGRSMFPSFEEGQFLIVSRFHYWFEKPDRGDVVVFHAPSNPTEDYIKRVIGLPGDRIEFRDQQIYINDKIYDEPYIEEICNRFSCQDEVWEEVPPDSYFVLGDNRNSSVDSRRPSVGYVSKEMLIGKVLFRYWPISELRVIGRSLLPTP